MAAKSRSTQVIASLGKQFVNTICPRASPHAASTAAAFSVSRRSAHSSAYDKNLEDQVRPAVVPDEVIRPESDKYWAPHPQTGVFGPTTEQNPTTTGSDCGFHTTSTSQSGEDSVLEEKAWFRPTSLEDLEKTHHN